MGSLDEPDTVAKSKIIAARQALRNAYGPTSEFSRVEKALLESVASLIQAVEAIDNPQHAMSFSSSEHEVSNEAQELEAIYANVRGSTDLATSHSPKFVISFPDVELSLEEIWPNDDAPDLPAPEDVIKVMQQMHSLPVMLAAEWLLIDSLNVRRQDEEPNGGMKWDGP